MVVEHYTRETTTVPTSSDSSALTVVVALIAVLFILGLGLFALRTSGYNFGGLGAGPSTTRHDINVDVNTPTAPTPTGGDATANP
jgi:hypothetical protein